MINTIKQNQKAVLAFLLALVMLIGILPFTATEAQAMTIDASGEVTWENGDSFTLYLVNKENPNKTETHTVTYDGEKWNDPKSSILPAHAFAYTGEVEDITYSDGAWSYTPVLQLDQSDAEKLANADVMIATGEASTDSELELDFAHYFAKVTFNILFNSEFVTGTDKVTALTVSGDDDVKAFIGETAADAIIAPRTYTAGNGLATVTVNGDTTLEVNVPENGLTFEAGKHYTFDLTVGKDMVKLTQVSTSNDFPGGWNDEIDYGVGIQDEGKTAWENGDQVVATLNSTHYGVQTATLTYGETGWTYPEGTTLKYLKNETPTLTAVYAPSATAGLGEYIVANASIVEETDGEETVKKIKIDFANVTRNYSRLRIAGLPNQTLTVTTTGFTPAGATSVATESYTLTTGYDGNAYLYGTFAEGATVTVKQGEVTLKEYTFTAEKCPGGTQPGTSYALDARPIIDGTFGGKDTASEEDVAALVEQLKTYVDNGITTIIVTGEEPAMITITGNLYSYTSTAIGEAIYRLSGSGNEENSTYLGKIDLILPDVTEIVDYEFQKAYALNSINLPKVTTVGENAFEGCWYLQELTFGSVVTLIKNDLAFSYVGASVDGGLCNLVLNRGQARAATEYLPDLNSNKWWNTQWKYIELI